MKKTRMLTLGLALLLGATLSTRAFSNSAGHGEGKSVQPKSYANPQNVSKCLQCHGQLDYLRSVSKETKDGYGHDVAAETVAQGLYVSQEFVNDRIHGRQSCEFCHGGDPTTMDAQKAHKDMAKDPTADGGKKLCASCHKELVDKYQTSIHFKQSGIGMKLSDRLGSTPHKESVVGKIMEGDCRGCHATCGTCHVGAPPVANVGLQKNHVFKRKPNNLQVCIPCHHLAGAGFFTQEKNLHTAVGMDCISCHNTEQQFHGRGGEGRAPGDDDAGAH